MTLEPWGSGDLPLLEGLMGDPRMTEHLGGPESPDKLRERQGRYERLEGGDRMFKIVEVRENEQYRFVSERADNATQKYGVKSISLLARKTA